MLLLLHPCITYTQSISVNLFVNLWVSTKTEFIDVVIEARPWPWHWHRDLQPWAWP